MRRFLSILIVILFLNIQLMNATEEQLNLKTKTQNQFDLIGLEAEISYKGELWNIARGKSSKDAVYVDNIDMIFNFDLEKSIGIDGGKVSFYILGNNGFEPNDYIGSMHGITNIAAPQTWKLYSFHYEQKLIDNRLSILIGTYDYNSEFDAKPSAGLFINPSQGIGLDIAQSGENGPSIFPTTSLGIRVKAAIMDNSYIQAVILDGVSGTPHAESDKGILLMHHDGLLISSEAGIAKEEENFKFGTGFWYYTAEYDQFFSNVRNWGVYSFIDSRMYSEKDKNQGLSGFVRLGLADSKHNDIGFFLAGGLTYTGLIPGRNKDIMGIAFASALTSDYSLSNDNIGHCDNNIELTYYLDLFDSIYLQPNLQYFFCPESNEMLDNYVAAGIRLGINIF